MIGTQISPILEEIEAALWEFEGSANNMPPEFTDLGFRAAIKIFMSALMDKMWLNQNGEEMSIEKRSRMAEMAGYKIRAIVLEYTGIDPYDLYK